MFTFSLCNPLIPQVHLRPTETCSIQLPNVCRYSYFPFSTKSPSHHGLNPRRHGKVQAVQHQNADVPWSTIVDLSTQVHFLNSEAMHERPLAAIFRPLFESYLSRWPRSKGTTRGFPNKSLLEKNPLHSLSIWNSFNKPYRL